MVPTRILFGIMACWLVAWGLPSCPPLRAEDRTVASERPSSGNQRYRMVLAPQGDLTRLLSGTVPVHRDEWARLLAGARQVDAPDPQQAYLEQIEIEGEWSEGDQLEGWMWLEVRSPEGQESYARLAPWSLAVEADDRQTGAPPLATGAPLRGSREDAPTLTDSRRGFVLGPLKESGRHTFRWSAGAAWQGPGVWQIPWELPRAVRTRVRLRLPSDLEPLGCQGLVVREMSGAEKTRRWSLHGRPANGKLLVRRRGSASPWPFVARESTTYLVRPYEVLARYRFALEPLEQPPRPLTLEISGRTKSLRIERGSRILTPRIRVVAEDRMLVEVSGDDLAGSEELTVTQLAAFRMGENGELPRVTSQQWLWTSGVRRLWIERPLILEDIETSDSAHFEPHAAASPRYSEMYAFIAMASDSPILLRATFEPLAVQLRVTEIVEIDGPLLQSRAFADLSALSGQGFEFSIPIEPSWSVLAVEVDPPAMLSEWYVDRSREPARLAVHFSQAIRPETMVQVVVSLRGSTVPRGQTYPGAALRSLRWRQWDPVSHLLVVRPPRDYQAFAHGAYSERLVTTRQPSPDEIERYGLRSTDVVVPKTDSERDIEFELVPGIQTFPLFWESRCLLEPSRVAERVRIRGQIPRGLSRLEVHVKPRGIRPFRWFLRGAEELSLTATRSEPGDAALAGDATFETWDIALPSTATEPLELFGERTRSYDANDQGGILIEPTVIALPNANEQAGIVSIFAQDDAYQWTVFSSLPPAPRSIAERRSNQQHVGSFHCDSSLAADTRQAIAVQREMGREPGGYIYRFDTSSSIRPDGWMRNVTRIRTRGTTGSLVRIEWPSECQVQSIRVDGQSQPLPGNDAIVVGPLEENARIEVDYTTETRSYGFFRSVVFRGLKLELPSVSPRWQLSSSDDWRPVPRSGSLAAGWYEAVAWIAAHFRRLGQDVASYGRVFRGGGRQSPEGRVIWYSVPRFHASCWLLFLSGLTLQCWKPLSLRAWLYLLGPVFGTLLLPLPFVGWGLALWGGLAFGILWRPLSRGGQADKPNPSRMAAAMKAFRSWGLSSSVFLVCGGLGHALLAQAPPSHRPIRPPDRESVEPEWSPPVHRVINPVDGQGAPAGDVVYVDTAFYDQLIRQVETDSLREPRIVSARYRGQLRRFESGKVGCPAILVEYHVRDEGRQASRLGVPMTAELAQRIRGNVRCDGEERTWGYDDEHAMLYVDCAAAEEHEVTFSIQYREAESTAGELAMDIPRVPDAVLELSNLANADRVTMPTALGAVRHSPTSHRIVGYLGPASQLVLRWDPLSSRTRGSVRVRTLVHVAHETRATRLEFSIQSTEGNLPEPLRIAVPSSLHWIPQVEENVRVEAAPRAGRTARELVVRPIDSRSPLSKVRLRFLWHHGESGGSLTVPMPALVEQEPTEQFAILEAEQPGAQLVVQVDDNAKPLAVEEFSCYWDEWETNGRRLFDLGPLSKLQLSPVRSRASSLLVEQQQTIIFSPSTAKLDFEAAITPGDRLTLEYQVRLPVGIRLQNVSVEQSGSALPARWSVGRNGELHVFLGVPVMSRHILRVQGEVGLPPEGRFALPLIRMPAAMGGHTVEIRRHAEAYVRLEDSEDWSATDSREAMEASTAEIRHVANLVASNRDAAPPQAIVQRNRPRFDAEMSVSLRHEGNWIVTVAVAAQQRMKPRAEQIASLDYLEFSLPPTLGELRQIRPALPHEMAQNANGVRHLTVWLPQDRSKDPSWSTRPLELEFSLGSAEAVRVQPPTLVGAETTTQWVALPSVFQDAPCQWYVTGGDRIDDWNQVPQGSMIQQWWNSSLVAPRPRADSALPVSSEGNPFLDYSLHRAHDGFLAELFRQSREIVAPRIPLQVLELHVRESEILATTKWYSTGPAGVPLRAEIDVHQQLLTNGQESRAAFGSGPADYLLQSSPLSPNVPFAWETVTRMPATPDAQVTRWIPPRLASANPRQTILRIFNEAEPSLQEEHDVLPSFPTRRFDVRVKQGTKRIDSQESSDGVANELAAVAAELDVIAEAVSAVTQRFPAPIDPRRQETLAYWSIHLRVVKDRWRSWQERVQAAARAQLDAPPSADPSAPPSSPATDSDATDAIRNRIRELEQALANPYPSRGTTPAAQARELDVSRIEPASVILLDADVSNLSVEVHRSKRSRIAESAWRWAVSLMVIWPLCVLYCDGRRTGPVTSRVRTATPFVLVFATGALLWSWSAALAITGLMAIVAWLWARGWHTPMRREAPEPR